MLDAGYWFKERASFLLSYPASSIKYRLDTAAKLQQEMFSNLAKK